LILCVHTGGNVIIAKADYWRRDEQVFSVNFSSAQVVARLWRCFPGNCIGYAAQFYNLQLQTSVLVFVCLCVIGMDDVSGTTAVEIMEQGESVA
jgi:hypothetical protein